MGVVVPLEGQDASAQNAFDTLRDLVADDIERVNGAVLKRMESEVSLIPRLAGHLITSGGKRLRPMLTLASARIAGYEGLAHVDLAACVEFLHTATLLHDDVVDESDLRRGKDTANVIWGNQASVLVGDFLLSRAFQLMVEIGSLRVLEILSRAAGIIAEGEVMQLAAANDTQTTEDSYLQIISAKTATLFAAACQIGAVVADRPRAEEQALESYGRNFGIAYQLVDDALDYSAQQATLGKAIGDDFREGKVTLPVVLAYRRGAEDERRFWRRVIEERRQTGGDFERALELMAKHGALADTVERARHYGAMARDAMAIFEDSPVKDAMTGIVDFCIERAY